MSDKIEGETPEPKTTETPVAIDAPIPTPATTPKTTAVDPVADRLKELGITDDAIIQAIKKLGASSVGDLEMLQEADLSGAGLPVLQARKVYAELKKSSAPSDTPSTTAEMMERMGAILPSLPESDESWLKSLRTDGMLKTEDSTVISAIRVALADKYRFYSIPKRIVEAMERYVDMTEDQVGPDYWKIRHGLTRSNYGDLFAAIPGLDGNYVTVARKKTLLQRISTGLWPAILRYNDTLKGWQDSWMSQGANPAMMTQLILGAQMGGGVMPGMMPIAPPDCGILQDAAMAVNDSLNTVLKGDGVQITAALAFEANEIKKTLSEPRIPQLCGFASRELMLKSLEVNVPAIYTRLEQNITQFVMGILKAESVPASSELQYYSAMYQLSTQIPWTEIEGMSERAKTTKASRRVRGIGGNDPFGDADA